MSWDFKTLDELGKVARGKSKHRPRNDKRLFGGIYPFIQTADVKKANFYIYEYSETYNEIGLAQSKLWDAGTLCITIAANIADTGILSMPACFPDSIMGFIPYDGISDVRFIKYCFDILQRKCKQISQGTAQDNLSWEKLSTIKFPAPPLKIQCRIAEVLSRYDSLIENYQKQIKLLEEAAQRLYKEWFVDLRFPGYEKTKIVDGLPEGWSFIRIKDRYKTVLGGTPSRFINSYWGGDISWINSGEINKLRIIKPSEKITQDGYKNSSTKLMPIHTTILAITGATLGQVSYTEIETCANQSVVGIIDEENTTNEFLYLNIYNNIHSMINKATGGAQQHINKDIVSDYFIMLPDESILIEFRKRINPIFNTIRDYFFIIEDIIEARDRLLPKLMNGEIEV
ncbi:restriction endonuclease subunit S [Phocaeicola plebeius]|jgi:type I restriction enzyme S subunit|uniref:Restriction endonuclease subunit S n=1 Tax=Phocaeicola plebeius TaxID=310297 RepID=A0A415STP3_9BACT|nr:restriction endonuclease subunit S [Phocaeicola plebeius]RHF91767.1 restriction endonuclease subunit S [Phocaeicola plebeius]RHM92364.1 restriction endonuclease subunit S [Phocaeicola plebeius]DAK76388.1 MAG TPA: hypothetical protein [Caudoviricetes sp.]